MADLDRRELERRAAAGDVEAESRLLLERVRAGELSEEALRLAGFLGDAVARRVVGGGADPQAETDPTRCISSAPFAAGPFRNEVIWRAYFAARHETAAEWDEQTANSGAWRGQQIVTRVEADLRLGRPIVDHYGTVIAGIADSVWFADERRVWRAITRELVSWALGYRDPVRERIEARERERTS